MSLTPSRQRNSVSEGVALGLAVIGHNSIPFNKTNIDLSFEGAWRAWEYRGRFSQVNTDLHNGLNGTWVMTHAESSRQTWVLYWEKKGGELVICARDDDWDPGSDADIQFALRMIDGNVPLEGWMSLARDFLDRMNL